MDVSMFFAENVAKPATTKYVVSERFKDKEGKPIEWELKPVPSAKEAKIKRDCFRKKEFDNIKYTQELVAASVVEPNLSDAKLQDSYHVFNETELLEAMLTSGEFNLLTLKVLEINGLQKPLDDLIQEAKN